MWPVLLLAVAIAPLIPGGQDAKGPTPRERFEALLKQYPGGLGTYINDKPKAKAASAPFIKLAREHSGDPVAFEALNWVATHTLFSPMAGEAMGLLASRHINDPRLAATIEELDKLQGMQFEPFEKLLRAASSSSKHRETKGRATFALGRYLMKWKKRVLWERGEHELYVKSGKGSFWLMPAESDADLDRVTREAEALFRQTLNDYGDLAGLAKAAIRESFELHNLSIGMAAPEIEGTDLDGKAFKLSEYRGKVVVLDFWNHSSCGVCRGMYPELRRLVERMKDKPFVLLGINTDDEPAALRKLVDQGVVTWRFWCDGESDQGLIVNKWNVHGWPTTFVLDAKGVIRYRKLLDDDLDAAVDLLVKEAEGEGPARKSE